MWLTARPTLMEMMREKIVLTLIKACIARFGTHFLVGARLLELNTTLVEVSTAPTHEAWIETLEGADTKESARQWRVLRNRDSDEGGFPVPGI